MKEAIAMITKKTEVELKNHDDREKESKNLKLCKAKEWEEKKQ